MSSAKFRNFIIGIGISLLPLAAAAEPAPVEDLSQGGGYNNASVVPNISDTNDQSNISNPVPQLPLVDATNMTLPERMNRVEQQVDNLIQMNMPQQIAELQKQVQQLSGQIQELSHQLDQASRQQQRVEALPAVTPLPAGAPPSVQQPPNPEIVNAANAPAKTVPPSSTATTPDAAAYQAAFDLLSNKQYDQAAVTFKDYLLKHPDGQFTANAHYWLGDIYFQQKNLTQAELELNLVIVQYASSGKAPDAQFKIALIHAQQGKTDQAREELRAIMTRYPGSSAAQLASIQLQQLNAASGP